MDVAVALAERAKVLEQQGKVPYQEGVPVWAKSPPGSKYPPLSRTVGWMAAFALYDYFVGRYYDDDYDRVAQEQQPYDALVIAAWQQGRNMKSIRLLAILAEEAFDSMAFYRNDVAPNLRTDYFRRAAKYLGIESDWPELRKPDITDKTEVEKWVMRNLPQPLPPYTPIPPSPGAFPLWYPGNR
jgi:hypothetical protein